MRHHDCWILTTIILLFLALEGYNNSNAVLGFSLPSVFQSVNDKGCKRRSSCCSLLLKNSDNNAADDDQEEEDVNQDDRRINDLLREQYLSGQQPSPQSSPNNNNDGFLRPKNSKLGIYDNDEVENLLELHEELYPQAIDDSADFNIQPSLHELVVQTVEGITVDDNDEDNRVEEGDSSSTFMFDKDRFKYLVEDKYQQQPKEFQPPFFDTIQNNRPPNKADVYDTDELTNLLELHEEIYPQTNAKNRQQSDEEEDSNSSIDDPMEFIPSLHELVVQTVEGLADGSAGSSTSTPPNYPWLTNAIKQKIPSIIAIASDVDGTLVGSDQLVHPKTKAAVMAAIQEVDIKSKKLQHFIPATGKTRAGALNSLGPELGQYISKCPGVFIQGLYCISRDGNVIFEKKLPTKAIEAAEQLVAEYGTSIIAYDGDDLYTTDLTQFVMELHEIYCEPLSKEIPSIAHHKPGVHKILICDNDLEKLATIRPKLEELAKSNEATVTQAMPGMLELLPEGCSKALGVEKMCQHLGIDPSTQLLAIGDAENDVEMLELSAIGVCVGNGSDLAKDAADIVLDETNDEGGAGIAIEVLGGL